jgi:hypothetical protein
VGHCTLECSCCARARGFKLDPRNADNCWQKANASFFSALEDPSNKTYYARCMRAFFTGIESEMNQAPKWKR